MGEYENATDIAAIKERIKTLFETQRDQSKLISEIHNISRNIEVVAEAMKYIKIDIEDVKQDVDEFKAKPSKRWEAIVGAIIGSVVTGLITYVLIKLGLR